MKNAHEPRFARVAAMIGDASCDRMLAALLDGALMTVRTQGRHRYFRLADGDVAHALEALAVVADKDAATLAGRSLWSRDAMQPLRHARACYGHLAGHLGGQLHDALITRSVVTLHDERYVLDDAGHRCLDRIGFDAKAVAPSPCGIAYPCVDWSERRDHFAGPLAAALLDHFVAQRWLTRVGGSRAFSLGPRADRSSTTCSHAHKKTARCKPRGRILRCRPDAGYPMCRPPLSEKSAPVA